MSDQNYRCAACEAKVVFLSDEMDEERTCRGCGAQVRRAHASGGLAVPVGIDLPKNFERIDLTKLKERTDRVLRRHRKRQSEQDSGAPALNGQAQADEFIAMMQAFLKAAQNSRTPRVQTEDHSEKPAASGRDSSVLVRDVGSRRKEQKSAQVSGDQVRKDAGDEEPIERLQPEGHDSGTSPDDAAKTFTPKKSNEGAAPPQTYLTNSQVQELKERSEQRRIGTWSHDPDGQENKSPRPHRPWLVVSAGIILLAAGGLAIGLFLKPEPKRAAKPVGQNGPLAVSSGQTPPATSEKPEDLVVPLPKNHHLMRRSKKVAEQVLTAENFEEFRELVWEGDVKWKLAQKAFETIQDMQLEVDSLEFLRAAQHQGQETIGVFTVREKDGPVRFLPIRIAGPEGQEKMRADVASFLVQGEMSWSEFLSQRPFRPTEMRAVLKMSSVFRPPYSEEDWSVFYLTPRYDEQGVYAYTKKETEVDTKMRKTVLSHWDKLQKKGLSRPESLRVPVIVRLACNPQAKPDQVEVTDLLQVGWYPHQLSLE